MHDAFTFLIAVAWSKLFNDVFRMVVGDSPHILMRLLHAFMFTLLGVVVTILFEPDDAQHED